MKTTAKSFRWSVEQRLAELKARTEREVAWSLGLTKAEYKKHQGRKAAEIKAKREEGKQFVAAILAKENQKNNK